METDDLISPLLVGAGIDGDELGGDNAMALCGLLGLDPSDPLTAELIDEFAVVGAKMSPGSEPKGAYGFRVGDWKIGLGSPVRFGLLTVMVAGALHQRGLGEFTIGMATAVIPTVLEVRKVELDAGDQRLLLELRLSEGVRSGFMSEDELYASLSAETRRVVNKFDFADFVKALRDLAFVDVDESGERLMVKDPADRRPFISFHE